ncbi:MAG: hydrogenase maturation nickel metallochaperone HypA [Candidatus Thermoplasmatota archaeon]
MHEYSVMNQLVSALLDELEGEKENIERVKKVRIEVGELTFLGEDQLKFAFETLSKDTIVEGAELDIEKINSEVRCENCGYEGGINYSEDPAFHYSVPVISCPECDSKPKIVKGKETKIVGVTAVEKEEEDEA